MLDIFIRLGLGHAQVLGGVDEKELSAKQKVEDLFADLDMCDSRGCFRNVAAYTASVAYDRYRNFNGDYNFRNIL